MVEIVALEPMQRSILFALWAIQDFSRRHRFLALDLWGGQFEYRIPVLISETEIALRAEGFNFRLTFQIEPLAGGSVVFAPARVGGKNHFLAHDDKNPSRADLFCRDGPHAFDCAPSQRLVILRERAHLPADAPHQSGYPQWRASPRPDRASASGR